MYSYAMTRICLYDPGFPSDSPVAAIKRIAEEEARKYRALELAEVTSIYPHDDKSDNNNYECDVKLKNGGNELRKVAIVTSHIGLTWVPNIGDLVLIGYIGGSVNSPVVIGSLYNDDQRPPVNKANRTIIALPGDIDRKQDFVNPKEWEGFEWDAGGLVHAIRKTPGTRFLVIEDATDEQVYAMFGTSGTKGVATVQATSKLYMGVAPDLKSFPKYSDIQEEILVKADKNIRIECGGLLTIKAGSLNISSGNITINGSAIALASSGELEIDGGTVGISSSGGMSIVSGGMLSASASGDLNLTGGGNALLGGDGETLVTSGGGTKVEGSSINVKSDGTLNIDASGELNETGGSVLIGSDGNVNIHSGAGATVEGSATVDIKGAIVKIN